jgi:hypothetical protein
MRPIKYFSREPSGLNWLRSCASKELKPAVSSSGVSPRAVKPMRRALYRVSDVSPGPVDLAAFALFAAILAGVVMVLMRVW